MSIPATMWMLPSLENRSLPGIFATLQVGVGVGALSGVYIMMHIGSPYERMVLYGIIGPRVSCLDMSCILLMDHDL